MDARTPLASLSAENLWDEIGTLSATLSAATYRLIALIGELERRGAFADPLANGGFRTAAHFLAYRAGLDLGAAREHVRIAKALPTLPKIAAAFARGELSYSKVRAVTRIATPALEDDLLDLAQAGTATHVEKIVRGYRRASRPAENARALAQHAERRLRVYWDDDGMLVVEGRLPPEQGAVFLQALEASREALRRRREPDAVVATPADEAAGLPAGTSTFGTTGSSDVPAEVSRKAKRYASRDLQQDQADALAHLAARALAAREDGSTNADRFLVVVHVDAEVLADPEADGRAALADGPTLGAEVARRLACDASVAAMVHLPDGSLASGRKHRLVTGPLRRALLARDGTRCSFPGCGTSRGTEAHHAVHWANGGPTKLLNVGLLCGLHHKLCHEGGFAMVARPEGGFRFVGPDGQEVPASPPVPAVAGDPLLALSERYLPPGLEITPETSLPTWDGEPLDLAWVVDGLLDRATR